MIKDTKFIEETARKSLKFQFGYDCRIEFENEKKPSIDDDSFIQSSQVVIIQPGFPSHSNSLQCKYVFKNIGRYVFCNLDNIKTTTLTISDVNKICLIVDNLLENAAITHNFFLNLKEFLDLGFLNKYFYKFFKKTNIKYSYLNIEFIFKSSIFSFRVEDQENYIKDLKLFISKFIELKKIMNPSIELDFLLKFDTLDELLDNTNMYKLISY